MSDPFEEGIGGQRPRLLDRLRPNGGYNEKKRGYEQYLRDTAREERRRSEQRTPTSYESQSTGTHPAPNAWSGLKFLGGSGLCLALGIYLMNLASTFSLVWFIGLLLVLAGIPILIAAGVLVFWLLVALALLALLALIVSYFIQHPI